MGKEFSMTPRAIAAVLLLSATFARAEALDDVLSTEIL